MEPFHADLLIGLSLGGYSGDGQPSRGDPLCLGWLQSQASKDHQLKVSRGPGSTWFKHHFLAGGDTWETG